MIDAVDTATSTARRDERGLRRATRRLRAGRRRPDRNIYQSLATSGRVELRRLLQPAARPDPRERAEGDDAKARATLYRAAQQIIHDDRPIIVLYNPITFAAFSASLDRRAADLQRRS